MIRRSPAELYIKYLLVHPYEYSNAEIIKICQLQQVDILGDGYLNRLRTAIVPPAPFYPTDINHSRSIRFLYREKLYLFFYPTEDSRRAAWLLEKPRAKELIESMVLTAAPNALIVGALRKNGYDSTVPAVQHFRQFYYNLENVDSTEARALLLLRDTNDANSTDPEVLSQAGVLAKARYRDPRNMAAFSVSSPAASLINMLRMGIMPSNVEIAKIASFTRAAATIRAFETTLSNGPGDSARASDYSLVAKSMNEILESVGSPEEDLNRGLSAISLRTDGHEVPILGELTGGEHTAEMQRTGEEQDVDGE